MEEGLVIDFTELTPPRPTLEGEQKSALEAKGSTIVTACPGAGKTEVVIQRIENNYASGIETLALVFSRAAAEEIRKRCPKANVHTIHSYCHSMVGWKNNFSDLLYRFVADGSKMHYNEIVVDELQDLSPLQMDVILSLKSDTIFAVGDPFQSIFIGEWARSYFDAPSLGTKAFDILSRICKNELTISGSRRSKQEILDILNHIYPRNLKTVIVKSLERTAVIARSHVKLQACSEILNLLGVPHILYKRRRDTTDPRCVVFGENPSVELLVAHYSKGKQYKRVIVLDWNSFSLEETNLLYTAASRAAEEVYFSPSGGIITKYIPERFYCLSWTSLLRE